MDMSFLWLELTGLCNLSCRHCYAGSGPDGTHGAMSVGEWFSVIDQAADMGVSMIQLIGGEPTLHPAFPDLLRYAVDSGLAVEVYSNLSRVKPEWWEIFSHPDVSLATSYYSDMPAEHDAITRRRGSHSRTLANIKEALARNIPLRVGIVDTGNGQRAGQARAELESVGVTSIGIDRERRLGRAATASEPDASQLCGKCGDGCLAISPEGTVWPCVFSRWLPVGNVRQTRLADIAAGQALADTMTGLREVFEPDRPCVPKMCDPQCGPNCSPTCNPQSCKPICRPQYNKPSCSPSRNCNPNKCRPTGR